MSSSYNWGKATQHGGSMQESVAYNQTLVPIYAWRRVVKFFELMSFDEQEKLKGRDVARLGVGECFIYIAGKVPFAFKVPYPPERISTQSSYYQQELSSLITDLHQLPCYEMGGKIIEDRETIAALAIEHLARLQKGAPLLPDMSVLDDPTTGV